MDDLAALRALKQTPEQLQSSSLGRTTQEEMVLQSLSLKINENCIRCFMVSVFDRLPAGIRGDLLEVMAASHLKNNLCLLQVEHFYIGHLVPRDLGWQ